jgi:hypothetical protein
MCSLADHSPVCRTPIPFIDVPGNQNPANEYRISENRGIRIETPPVMGLTGVGNGLNACKKFLAMVHFLSRTLGAAFRVGTRGLFQDKLCKS